MASIENSCFNGVPQDPSAGVHESQVKKEIHL